MPGSFAISRKDIGLRLTGLALLALSAFSIRMAYHMVHGLPPHDSTAFEFIMCAVGFLGLSTGSALLAIGIHVFDRIEVTTFRQQRNDADILGHSQLSGHAPPGLIHQQHAVGTRFDGERYFRQAQRHCLGVAEWKDQASPFAQFRADGTEDVS